ncbi:hypothetical protein SY2F82_53290 [Streptomyces sp. Y2F8-2]|nr:hypothetical protein SY2F82_53290 [Streptomyces sp. Y2F8-2]
MRPTPGGDSVAASAEPSQPCRAPSPSDPEVLYITAHATAHDVNCYVEPEWSSGGRQGTTRIDDHGNPFRPAAVRAVPSTSTRSAAPSGSA